MISTYPYHPGDLVCRTADGTQRRGTLALLLEPHKIIQVKAWKVLVDGSITIWTEHNFMYAKSEEVPRE